MTLLINPRIISKGGIAGISEIATNLKAGTMIEYQELKIRMSNNPKTKKHLSVLNNIYKWNLYDEFMKFNDYSHFFTAYEEKKKRSYRLNKPKLKQGNAKLNKDDRHRIKQIKSIADQGVEVMEGPEGDSIDHPSHYNQGRIEIIDVIEDQNLNFRLGNAIKYICRAEHKGKKNADLQKAIWYLEREISKGGG